MEVSSTKEQVSMLLRENEDLRQTAEALYSRLNVINGRYVVVYRIAGQHKRLNLGALQA